MRELVMQLFVREFASHTSIDFSVGSHRIMLLRNNTLRIVNSSRADEGKYTCFAENYLGKANSTGHLSVRGTHTHTHTHTLIHTHITYCTVCLLQQSNKLKLEVSQSAVVGGKLDRQNLKDSVSYFSLFDF